MDNVSFHSLNFAHRWNFVFNRRLALERELNKEAEKNVDVMKLIEKAGLKKTVLGVGECYKKLVKEFLVNIPADCDNPISK
ncbi:envelope-like protein, partial [Trifolium medium]|nr:envelope-like protein [Trifolium medium]